MTHECPATSKDPKDIALVALLDSYEALMKAWDAFAARDEDARRTKVALQAVAGMCDLTKTAAHAYAAVINTAERSR